MIQLTSGLELVNPQSAVAPALSLLGVDQAIEVRDGTNAGADPEREEPDLAIASGQRSGATAR
jgi:hypothetical protein